MEDVLRSGPFTSVNLDRQYTNEFFIDYFASFIGNGVFPNPSNNLQVIADNGLTVIVKKGKAWINGRIHLGDDDISLTLDAGDSLLSRIDKVVLRVNALTRTITKEIKKGTPATNPVAPSLQRDSDIYELGLANILVSKGVTSISQSNITDLRLNKNECGIVKGTIEEIDTTTLFNQYQVWLQEKKSEYDVEMLQWTKSKQLELEGFVTDKNREYTEYVEGKQLEYQNWYDATTASSEEEIDILQTQLKQQWDIWFAGIQDALDGDVAGNLLNKIDAIPLIFTSSIEPENIRIGDIWLREVE